MTGGSDISNDNFPKRRMRPALGCFTEVGIWDGPDPEQAFASAYAAINEIEQLMSFHNPDSELSRLNKAGARGTTVSSPTLRVLRLSRALTAKSNDRFNCTVGGTLVRAGALPDHDFGDVLRRGDASDILIDGNHVALRRPVLVTLDGIAKGFAVDRAVRALKACGVSSGWVNAGGDLRVFGEHLLTIERRDEHGSPLPWGQLGNAALATSQIGRPDPERFPSMLVGANGPSQHSGSVTILARQAWRADALTKIAASLQGPDLKTEIERLGGVLAADPESGEVW